MKIRNGFVSNSSSSSFVILLPDSFDIESVDFEEFSDPYGDNSTPENIKKAFNQLKRDKCIWEEEDFNAVSALEKILDPYIIGEVDTSSDGGQIVLADKEKVKKVLDED